MLNLRTLTNLYNQRPQWLIDAHRDLDAAVAAAYGWPSDISEEGALAKLLALNLSQTAAQDRSIAGHKPESAPVKKGRKRLGDSFLRSEPITDQSDLVREFRAGLKDAGFVDGENVALEIQSAEGQVASCPAWSRT
jgi:hypothetical protein